MIYEKLQDQPHQKIIMIQVRMPNKCKHEDQTSTRLPSKHMMDRFIISHQHQVGTAPGCRESLSQPASKQAVASMPAIPKRSFTPLHPEEVLATPKPGQGRAGNHAAAKDSRLKFMAPSLSPRRRPSSKWLERSPLGHGPAKRFLCSG